MKEVLLDNELEGDVASPEEPKEETGDSSGPMELSEVGETAKLSPEDIALGSKPPLKTLLILSVGPFISQLTQALFGFVDTIWVEKGTGTRGVTAVSTYSNFDTIGRAFGFFLNVAASTKISALFGAGRADEAPQVVADLLRVGLIFAVVVPAILIPCLKPAAKWFGASDDITNYGWEYIFPVILCAFIPILYLLVCGCLLAEGRTYTFGALQLTTLALNILFFDPLFLLPLKMEMFGNALATILSEGLPMVTIVVLYFLGKFGVKPKARDLFRKFSPHTVPALKVGLSQLLYQLSLAVPGIVLRKFLGLSCGGDDELFLDVVTAFNAQIRYYQIVFCVTGAVTMGLLPCGSYAFGAERWDRYFRLLIHCSWICFSWCFFTMIFTVGVPRYICMALSQDEGYLIYAEQMVRNSNVVAFLSPVALIIQAVMQSLQRGVRASIISFGTQLFPLPVFSIVLYYTNKSDPGRLLYAYAIQQAIGVLVSVPLGIGPLLDVWKRAKKEQQEPIVEQMTVKEIAEDKSGQFIDTGKGTELEDIAPDA